MERLLGRRARGDLVFFVNKTTATTTTQDSFVDAVCAVARIDSSIFHVAVVLDDEDIVHATTKRGVVREPFEEAVERLNPAALELYTLNVPAHDKQLAVQFALAQVGAAYNDVFADDCRNSLGRPAFYCCQLVAKAFGRHLFPPHTLNFLDNNGNPLDYWVQYFRDRHRPLPQDEPGTHPSVLVRSPLMQLVERHVLLHEPPPTQNLQQLMAEGVNQANSSEELWRSCLERGPPEPRRRNSRA